MRKIFRKIFSRLLTFALIIATLMGQKPQVVNALTDDDFLAMDLVIMTFFNVKGYDLSAQLYENSINSAKMMIFGSGKYLHGDYTLSPENRRELLNHQTLQASINEAKKKAKRNAIAGGNGSIMSSLTYDFSGDMGFALHNVDYIVDVDYSNGGYHVWVTIIDDYNFDPAAKYESYIDVAANVLHSAQEAKHIKEFKVEILFDFMSYEESPSEGSPQPNTPPTSPSAPSVPQPPQSTVPTKVTNQPYNRKSFDKGRYTGDWRNGAPHGYGTLTYDGDNKYKIHFSGNASYSGKEYVGNWRNGQKYDQGVFTFTNNAKYDGEWNVNGVYFYGYYIDPDGNRHRVRQTLRADMVTVDSEWIGDWEYVNPPSTPTPPPAATPRPTPPPTNNKPPDNNGNSTNKPQLSGWTKIEDMPKNAEVSDRKWTYSTTGTFESTDDSVRGATKIGERWEQTDSGSREYAYFPSGFDTSHSIYLTYDSEPVEGYDNGSTKREVSDSHSGYIYWHWTYEPGSPSSSVDNRYIQSYRGYDSSTGFNFNYFHAVVSGQDYPFDAGANAHKWNGGGDYWTWWWYQLELRRSDYVDYEKYYTYSSTQEAESSSYPTGKNITGIQEWVKYTMPQQAPVSTEVEPAPELYADTDEDAMAILLYWYGDRDDGYYLWRDGRLLNDGGPIYDDEFEDYDIEPSERYAYQLENISTGEESDPISVVSPDTDEDRDNVTYDAEIPTSHSVNLETSAAKTISLFTGHGSGFDKLYIDDAQVPIDNSGTTPIIQNGRTLVPIRSIIENLGGRVEWDGNQRSVKCWLNNHYVQMWVDSTNYYVDYITGKTAEECLRTFEVAPILSNDRTMIPLRGVLEALGCTVDWEQNGGGNGWDMITVVSPAS